MDKTKQIVGLIAVLVVAALLAFRLAWLQSGWDKKSDTNVGIVTPTNFPDFSSPVPIEDNKKEIVLYSNFVMTQPITVDNIVNISRVVHLKGKIDSGELNVQASTTKYGYDNSRVHNVYFFVDDGVTGGDIDSIKKDGQVVSGGFTILKNNPYIKSFDLKQVPVSKADEGSQTLDLVKILSNNKQHYMGAFVTTGIYGSLDKLSITYRCSSDTPDCSLELVK